MCSHCRWNLIPALMMRDAPKHPQETLPAGISGNRSGNRSESRTMWPHFNAHKAPIELADHGPKIVVENEIRAADQRFHKQPAVFYWIELAAVEKTLLAFEPTSRIVPTTMTRMTASITAYSAMSWPCSSVQSLDNTLLHSSIIRNLFVERVGRKVWSSLQGLFKMVNLPEQYVQVSNVSTTSRPRSLYR